MSYPPRGTNSRSHSGPDLLCHVSSGATRGTGGRWIPPVQWSEQHLNKKLNLRGLQSVVQRESPAPSGL
jgi:hypothetical protein